MAIIQNLRSGQSLFKDMYNRVGVLQFDAVFQDIIDVFSTTPKEEEDLEKIAIDTGDRDIEISEEEVMVLSGDDYEGRAEESYTEESVYDVDSEIALDIAFSEDDIFQKEQL